jgi:tetratricopeptide (TPR) repeat protein
MLRSVFILLPSLLIWSQQLPQATKSEAKSEAKAEDVEGLPFAEIVAPMLLKGVDAQAVRKAAALFLEDSRPLQAKILYKAALELQPDSAESRAGMEQTEERLAHLEKRFQEFKTNYETGGDILDGCSMAVIRFHQGYPERALGILEVLKKQNPGRQDPVALAQTFRGGWESERASLARLEKEMHVAAMEGQWEKACQLFGRMIYIGIGNPVTFAAFERVQAISEGKIRPEAVAVLAKLQQFHLEKGNSQ